MNLDLTIATNRFGDHVVVFPGRRDELLPPEQHQERMMWIRSSFKNFLRVVREFDSLQKMSN